MAKALGRKRTPEPMKHFTIVVTRRNVECEGGGPFEDRGDMAAGGGEDAKEEEQAYLHDIYSVPVGRSREKGTRAPPSSFRRIPSTTTCTSDNAVTSNQ